MKAIFHTTPLSDLLAFSEVTHSDLERGFYSATKPLSSLIPTNQGAISGWYNTSLIILWAEENGVPLNISDQPTKHTAIFLSDDLWEFLKSQGDGGEIIFQLKKGDICFIELL